MTSTEQQRGCGRPAISEKLLGSAQQQMVEGQVIMTLTEQQRVEEIAAGLTKAQRRAIEESRWIGSMCVVDFDLRGDPWPEGIAQFLTLRTDRLTTLGIAVRTHLQEQAS